MAQACHPHTQVGDRRITCSKSSSGIHQDQPRIPVTLPQKQTKKTRKAEFSDTLSVILVLTKQRQNDYSLETSWSIGEGRQEGERDIEERRGEAVGGARSEGRKRKKRV